MDLQLYRLLVKQAYTTQDLATAVGKDRSTVHRSLQRLVSSGLCKRVCCLLDGGGRFFKYKAVSPALVEQRVLTCIQAWYESMQESLTNLFDEFYGSPPDKL